jgi:hypothetical protein
MAPRGTDEPLSTTVRTGAISGAAATVAMSAVMLFAQKLGLQGEQPPEAIVESAFDAGDVDRSERTENAVASVAHLGFGATCGAAYALLRRLVHLGGPELVHSVGFGLGVHTASYAGWIPTLGILPWPTRDRGDRQLSMVLAHVVYGAVLGALVARRQRRERATGASAQASG